MESLFPLIFSTFGWNHDYSNIGLFIFLYFTTAVIKNNLNTCSKTGGITWMLSQMSLIGSWALLHLLGSNGMTVFSEKEMFFYQYCSPLVIFAAIGLFLFFSKVSLSINIKFFRDFIKLVLNASMVIYLIHMHPVFKTKYAELGFFSWIDTSNTLYI